MRINLINFIFLILFSTDFVSGQYDCNQVKRCSKHTPAVYFPFRLKDHHPDHCGYPGFELYCSQSNEAVLDLPFSTNSKYSPKFIVGKIDYKSQLVTISKLDGCLPGLLPELNLSASPFQMEHPDNYTFFNCPSRRTSSSNFEMIPVPCLSSSSYYVYAVKSHQSFYEVFSGTFLGLSHDSAHFMPVASCSKMFSVSSVSFRLPILLSWSKPECGHREMEGKYCRLKSSGSIHDTECFPKEQVAGASKKKVTAGVVIGLSTMGVVIIALYLIYRSKNKKDDQKRIDQFLEDYKALRPTRYTYADIKKITGQFKEKLGQGGYATVYKGKLSNDILVAVKVIDNCKGNGEEFINEVGTIGKIHHKNVVQLVGYCADGVRRCLVYEFLPNDSLKNFISSNRRRSSLGWEKLQEIAVGIAKGLDYLHEGCNQRILHFDIKPQNILLDDNFNPKVADFGLAMLCSKEQSRVSLTTIRGTVGYIAPEVLSRNYGNVSYKADIYSFGMLLLDMVGGRKNFRAAVKDDGQVYFPEWMYNQLEKGKEIAVQIDEEEDDKIFKKLTIIGLWCIQWYPVDRPSMKVVIQMIKGDNMPMMPPNPFASTKSSATNARARRRKLGDILRSISEED